MILEGTPEAVRFVMALEQEANRLEQGRQPELERGARRDDEATTILHTINVSIAFCEVQGVPDPRARSFGRICTPRATETATRTSPRTA